MKELGPRFDGLEPLEGRWDPHKSFKTCTWPDLLKRPKPKTKEEAYDLVGTCVSSCLALGYHQPSVHFSHWQN